MHPTPFLRSLDQIVNYVVFVLSLFAVIIPAVIAYWYLKFSKYKKKGGTYKRILLELFLIAVIVFLSLWMLYLFVSRDADLSYPVP